MRDAFIISLLLLLVAVAAVGRVRAAPQPDRNRERAEAAYAAMQRSFWLPDRNLYRETTGDGGNPYAYHWPFGQALAATIDMAYLSGSVYRSDVYSRLVGLETYWDRAQTPAAYDSYVLPPLGQGGDVYYDDNEWAALELLRVYRLTGDPAALQRAQQVWELVVFGWDADPSHAAPGGIFWTQAPGSYGRGTVSNAPAAQLGLGLAAATGRPEYREWAIRIWSWVDSALRAPDDLYWDSIALDGAIDKTQWSYNQGTMIGASVLLYEQTGDAGYLERARRCASVALERYGADGFRGQPVAFNAIFWKNLQLLDAVQPDPRYREAMQRYADAAWDTARDPATGLFRFNPDRPPTLLDQAAMVQIYAALARAAELERTFVPSVTR